LAAGSSFSALIQFKLIQFKSNQILFSIYSFLILILILFTFTFTFAFTFAFNFNFILCLLFFSCLPRVLQPRACARLRCIKASRHVDTFAHGEVFENKNTFWIRIKKDIC